MAKHKKEEPAAADPPKEKDLQKEKDTVAAREAADQDIEKDFDLSDPDPTDDLDEGELAQRDNSND